MIVISWLKRNGFPGTFFDVLCGIDIGFACCLGKGTHVVNAFMVADATRP